MGIGFCQKKVNQSAANTRAAIIGNMTGMEIDRKELARRTQINYRTLCQRLADNESIGEMRLKELWAIDKVIQLNEHQKAGIF